MLDKKQSKQLLRQTKIDFGNQIFELRRKRKVSLIDIANDANIPMSRLEKLELGDILFVTIGDIHQIASFFNKRLKITFEDIITEEK